MITNRFRGLFVGGTDWVYGDLIHKRHTQDVLMIQDERGLGADVIPETVGISSGMTDSAGKEIFEGDILESAAGARIAIVRDGEAPCLVGISQIAWTYHKDNLRSEPRYLARNAASMTVIGNIHQNPELMHVDIKAGKR